MALARLSEDEVYRILIAHPLAFADWENPTAAELNANSSNAPGGLIYNITCALNVDGSTFDLDDSEKDESLTFCQKAGSKESMSRSATVVFDINMPKARWDDATSVLAADGFNTANLALSLLEWRGVEYFAILSIGKAGSETFAVGDRIKMAKVATDVAIPQLGTGENVTFTQTFAKRTDLNWNYKIVA